MRKVAIIIKVSIRLEKGCVDVMDDYLWFVDHYDDLRKLYGDSFLAIKGKRVLNAYPSYESAVKETQKTEPIGSFIVQECLKNGDMAYCCIASMNF